MNIFLYNKALKETNDFVNKQIQDSGYSRDEFFKKYAKDVDNMLSGKLSRFQKLSNQAKIRKKIDKEFPNGWKVLTTVSPETESNITLNKNNTMNPFDYFNNFKKAWDVATATMPKRPAIDNNHFIRSANDALRFENDYRDWLKNNGANAIDTFRSKFRQYLPEVDQWDDGFIEPPGLVTRGNGQKVGTSPTQGSRTRKTNSTTSLRTTGSQRYFNQGYNPQAYGVNNRDDVIRMLNELIANGYNIGSRTGKADGIWGRATQAAYEDYLRKQAQNTQNIITELPELGSVAKGNPNSYRSKFDYTSPEAGKFIRNLGFNNYQGLLNYAKAYPEDAFAMDLIQRFGDPDTWTQHDVESALGIRGKYRRGTYGDFSDMLNSMAKWIGEANGKHDSYKGSGMPTYTYMGNYTYYPSNNSQLTGTPLLGQGSSNNYNIDANGDVYYKGLKQNTEPNIPFNITFDPNKKFGTNLDEYYQNQLPVQLYYKQGGELIPKKYEGGHFILDKNGQFKFVKGVSENGYGVVKVSPDRANLLYSPNERANHEEIPQNPNQDNNVNNLRYFYDNKLPSSDIHNDLFISNFDAYGIPAPHGYTVDDKNNLYYKGKLISKDPVSRFKKGGIFKAQGGTNSNRWIVLGGLTPAEEYALNPYFVLVAQTPLGIKVTTPKKNEKKLKDSTSKLKNSALQRPSMTIMNGSDSTVITGDEDTRALQQKLWDAGAFEGIKDSRGRQLTYQQAVDGKMGKWTQAATLNLQSGKIRKPQVTVSTTPSNEGTFNPLTYPQQVINLIQTPVFNRLTDLRMLGKNDEADELVRQIYGYDYGENYQNERTRYFTPSTASIPVIGPLAAIAEYGVNVLPYQTASALLNRKAKGMLGLNARYSSLPSGLIDVLSDQALYIYDNWDKAMNYNLSVANNKVNETQIALNEARRTGDTRKIAKLEKELLDNKNSVINISKKIEDTRAAGGLENWLVLHPEEKITFGANMALYKNDPKNSSRFPAGTPLKYANFDVPNYINYATNTPLGQVENIYGNSVMSFRYDPRVGVVTRMSDNYDFNPRGSNAEGATVSKLREAAGNDASLSESGSVSYDTYLKPIQIGPNARKNYTTNFGETLGEDNSFKRFLLGLGINMFGGDELKLKK